MCMEKNKLSCTPAVWYFELLTFKKTRHHIIGNLYADLFSLPSQAYLSTSTCKFVNVYLNVCERMLTYFSNNTAVYRVHNPVDTSHSYISFLSTKTYYNSLLFPDIRHAYISPRPTDTSHICLSLSHILHVYVTLYRHTLP